MENESIANKLSTSQAISLILTLCSVSAMFLYLIYSKNIIFGSEAGGWTYEYFDKIRPIPFWIPTIVLLLIGVVIYIGSRLIHNHEIITLAVCFIIAIVIQVLINKIYPYSIAQLIKSDGANSFYTLALKYSPVDILSHYEILVKDFPLHAKANLPGKILFFQFLTIFTSSPKIMGYLIISISTLGGPLLYGICKNLFHDKKLALIAFVLYAIIPGKQFFFPILNTITPVIILTCMYFFTIYLDSKNKTFLMLLGISLYFQTIFDPLPLVTGILFVAVLLPAIGQKKVLIKELIPIVLIPMLSFISIYLFFLLFFSFNLWQAFFFILQDAANFNAENDRSYLIWVKENLKEFFFGAGLPTMMVFIYFVISIFSQWKTMKKNISNWPVENIYILGLIFTFGMILFLGINRGETTRLWIFQAVFFQIPVAFFLTKSIKNNTLLFIFAATLIAQSMITIQRVCFITP